MCAQVIFHDNDFEIFVDADGSTHYYKETEVNAGAADWDLCLNKPYNDGGYENSSRVFGAQGFDMAPVRVVGCPVRVAAFSFESLPSFIVQFSACEKGPTESTPVLLLEHAPAPCSHWR